MTQRPQLPQLEVDLFTPENELEQLDSGVSVSTTFVRGTGGLPLTIAGYNLQRKGMEIPDSPTLTEVYERNPPSGAEFSSTILTMKNEIAIVTHRPTFVKGETGIYIERDDLGFPLGDSNSTPIKASKSTLEPYGMYTVSDWLNNQSRKTLLKMILGDHVFGPDGNLLRIYERYVGNSIYCVAGEVSELVVVRGENRQLLSVYFYPISILLPSQNTSFRFARYNPTIQEPQIGDVSATPLSGVLPEPSQPQITHETASVTPSVTSYEGIKEPPGRVVVIREEDVPTGEKTIALARRDRSGILPNVVNPFRSIKSYILPEDMVLDTSVLKDPPTIGWFTGGLALGGACIAGSITAVSRMDISPYLAPAYAVGTILLSLSGGLLGLKAGDSVESRKERAGRVGSRAITLGGLGGYLQYPAYQPLGDPVFRRLLERPELTNRLATADMEIKYLDAFNTRFEQIKSERFVSQKRKGQRSTAYAIATVEVAAGVINVPEGIDGEEFYWNSVGRFWNDTHDIGLAVEYAEGLRTHGVFGENLKDNKPHMSFLRYMGYRADQLILEPIT